MDTEQYQERLRECPPPDSVQFLDYLRANNRVVDENDIWLLIENCKYHTREKGYYTAFLKPQMKYARVTPNMLFPSEWSSLFRLYQKYAGGWEFVIKAELQQSIRTRFHVHFIQYGLDHKRNKSRV